MSDNRFKMIIELDEERMIRDGLDVEAAWKQIEEMLIETEDIYMEEKGKIHTEDYGAVLFLEDLFEDSIWFMKYVCKYLVNYRDNVYDDMIEFYKEEGTKVCYE